MVANLILAIALLGPGQPAQPAPAQPGVGQAEPKQETPPRAKPLPRPEDLPQPGNPPLPKNPPDPPDPPNLKANPPVQVEGKPELQVQRFPIPAEAVALAWADVQKQPANVQPLLRYIWVPNGSKLSCQAVSYVVNATISNLDTPVHLQGLYNNQLVRLNLGLLADDTDPDITFQTLAAIWETVPNPYFRIETAKEIVVDVVDQVKIIKVGGAKVLAGREVLITAPINQLFVIEGVQGPWIRITVGGKRGWVSEKDVQVIKAKDVKIEQIAKKVVNFAEHTELAVADALQRATQSNNPIVRYDAWLVNAMTTLAGGKYYDWINIPRASAEQKKKGITDLQALLLKLGVDKGDIARLRSDERVAMFRSNVTGKPRQVEIFKGLQGRASTNEGRIFVTNDMRDNDVDPKRHAMRNLLAFKAAGREVIWEWKNGTHRYSLYDGDGNLVDSVPDNIAQDHEIPRPYTARLQPGISCLRCHGKGESKGVNPLQNDVQFMVASYKKRYPALDIFDDAADKTGVVPAVLKRLAGLYSGDLTKPVMRCRFDADGACFKITAGLTYQEMTEETTAIYNGYVYEMVTPVAAAKELGFLVAEDRAVDLLNWLLPPLPDTIGQGFNEEDPVVGALKAGLSVNRLEWEQAYVDAMNRTMLTIKQGGQKAQQNQQEAGQDAINLDPKKEKSE